jgi:hypothetical protein
MSHGGPSGMPSIGHPKRRRSLILQRQKKKKLGARILMIGISPDQNMGVPEIPRVYIVRFSSPFFAPGFMKRGLNVAHIGSGSVVRRYVRAFRGHFR